MGLWILIDYREQSSVFLWINENLRAAAKWIYLMCIGQTNFQTKQVHHTATIHPLIVWALAYDIERAVFSHVTHMLTIHSAFGTFGYKSKLNSQQENIAGWVWCQLDAFDSPMCQELPIYRHWHDLALNWHWISISLPLSTLICQEYS